MVRSQCPKSCYWAEHNGTQVLRTGNGTLTTFNKLLCAETQAELDAEIALLELLPAPKTKRQLARDLFLTFPAEVQERFAPVLQAVSAIIADAEVPRAVAAVQVPEEFATYKQQLLAVLS